MKKRVLALASAVMLVLGMQMTVCAASPTAQELLAPRVDIVIDLEDADITVAAGDVEVASTSAQFKVGVMEALQECLGEDITVKNIVDVKGEGAVALNVPGVQAGDSIKVLAYNNAAKNWEFLPAMATADTVNTVVGDNSKLVVLEDEAVALAATPSVSLDSSALVAPRTGEAGIAMVAFLALGCAAVVVASKKRLAAFN